MMGKWTIAETLARAGLSIAVVERLIRSMNTCIFHSQSVGAPAESPLVHYTFTGCRDAVWKQIEARATARGITVHTALREAIIAWPKAAA
jgi:hypothetical protein